MISGLMSAQGRRESRWDDTRSASGTAYDNMSRVGSSYKRKSSKKEPEDQTKRGESSTSNRNKAMRMSIRSSMDGRSQKWMPKINQWQMSIKARCQSQQHNLLSRHKWHITACRQPNGSETLNPMALKIFRHQVRRSWRERSLDASIDFVR